MPRIRQYAQKYANEDFLKEIAHRKIENGIKSDTELAGYIGMGKSSYCQRKHNPGSISVDELRKIIQVLWPDPVVLLKFLGYPAKLIPKDLATDPGTRPRAEIPNA